MPYALHQSEGYWQETGNLLKSLWESRSQEGGIGSAFSSLFQQRPELVSGVLMALLGGALGLTRKDGSKFSNILGPMLLMGGAGTGQIGRAHV